MIRSVIKLFVKHSFECKIYSNNFLIQKLMISRYVLFLKPALFYIQSNYDNNIYHNKRNIYFHLPFTGLAKHIVEIKINAQVVIFIFKCKFVYFKTFRLSQKIVQFSPYDIIIISSKIYLI